MPPPSPADRMRFSCTRCGLCCNRSPEVELSETLKLADVFVFRLMFKPYELPLGIDDYLKTFPGPTARSAKVAAFLSKRHLLESEALWSYVGKSRFPNNPRRVRKYVLASAITVDPGVGRCVQLEDDICAIYARRPLACQTVPFHYSRIDNELASTLRDFVANPLHRCDTGPDANEVLRDGELIDEAFADARRSARLMMTQDRAWKDALAKKISKQRAASNGFPTQQQIIDNDRLGASAIEILHAWKVASEIGVIADDDYVCLVGQQRLALERSIQSCIDNGWTTPSHPFLATLLESAREYQTEKDGLAIG